MEGKLLKREFMMADVLVVDDSETMRASVERILTEGGISSIGADNGVAAVESFEKNPDVKLIVTDYNMPEMDGITAIEKLGSCLAEIRC